MSAESEVAILAQAGMQIRKQSGHLIVCESACKGWHHSLPRQDNSSNLFV
jgi:hypothetical protein